MGRRVFIGKIINKTNVGEGTERSYMFQIAYEPTMVQISFKKRTPSLVDSIYGKMLKQHEKVWGKIILNLSKWRPPKFKKECWSLS